MKQIVLIAIFITMPLLANADNKDISVTVDGKTYQCSGDGSNPLFREVTFYHSDKCEDDERLVTVRFGDDPADNQKLCKIKSELVKDAVWGITINNGPCKNIEDQLFMSACLAEM